MVSYEFPPFPGGEGAYTSTLFGALQEQGAQVTLLTSDLLGTNGKSSFHNDIRYVPTVRSPPGRLLSFCYRARRALGDLHRSQHFDIVHYTNDYCGVFLPTRVLSVPLVATVHHPYALEASTVLRNLRHDLPAAIRYLVLRRPHLLDSLQARLISASDGIVAVSKFTAGIVRERRNIADKVVSVIPNSVDIDRFNPQVKGSEMRERWRVNGDPSILHVGRWDHYKGLEYLLDGFSAMLTHLPEAKLVLTGSGLMASTLLAMTRRLGIGNAVRLVGTISEQDLPKAYSASDCVVYPSLVEGFGIVLLEAMATGKPCIASNRGPFTEIISHGKNGILVDPRSTESLCQAMLTVLKDRKLARDLGRAARRTVEQSFTPQAMARETLAMYGEVLRMRDPRRRED